MAIVKSIKLMGYVMHLNISLISAYYAIDVSCIFNGKVIFLSNMSVISNINYYKCFSMDGCYL